MDIQQNCLEYELQVLTRVSSANGLNSIEFRATELKSLMRFWWRAFNDFENLNDMMITEGKIFGSTEEHRSPISFKAETLDKKIITYRCSNRLYTDNMTVKLTMRIGCNMKLKEVLGDKYLTFYDSLLRLSLVLGGLGKGVRKGEGVFCISNNKNSESRDIHQLLSLYIENIRLQKKQDQVKFIDQGEYYSYKGYCKLGHAWVREVIVGKKDIKKELLYNKVQYARKNGKAKVRGANRKSDILSPVYISCYGSRDYIYPIITMLNQNKCDFNIHEYYKIQKEEIICRRG